MRTVAPDVAGGMPGAARPDTSVDLRLLPAAAGAWVGAAAGVGLSPSAAGLSGLGAMLGLVGLLGGFGYWRSRASAVCPSVWLPGRFGYWRSRAAALRPGLRATTGQPTAIAGHGTRVVTATALVLAAAAAAFFAAAGQQQVRIGGGVGELVAGGASVRLSAEVRAPPHRLAPSQFSSEPRWTVRILATTLVARGRAVQTRTPLLVVGTGAWSDLVVGQQIEATGRLAAGEPGDSVSGFLRASRDPRIVAEPGPLAAAADYLRGRLRQACSGLPPDPAGLLPGLVVGDTSQLPPDLEEAMRATGLTHLTAVSGANITIIGGAVLYLLTAVGVRRLVRIGLAGVAVLAFIVVAGPEPSVLRAGVMGVVGLVGLASSRRSAGIPPLCLAAVLLLLADPWLSRAAGFALSVSATAGLVLLGRPVAAALESVLPRWAALALAVPLSAQAAVSPVSVLLSPSIPLLAVPANVLAEPVVAPVTVLGVIGAALAAVWVPAGQVPVWVAGWGLRWLALVARGGAQVPGGTLPWPGGLAGAVAVGLASALVLAGVLLLPRLFRSGDRASPALPVRVWIAGGLALAVLTALGVAAPGWLRGWPPENWRVVACAVGQGTAVAVRSSAGGVILLDTGPDPDLVDGCLQRLGVQRIDLLVLSHFHADHVDGLPGVLRGRSVGAALVTALQEPAGQARAALRELSTAAVPVVTAGAGAAGAVGDAQYRILAPTRVRASASGGIDAEDADVNDASLIVWIRARGVSVVGLGDAETDEQTALLRDLRRDPGVVPVDVVVVAHHGSATQERAVYELLAPRVALIPVGADNDYGHPAPSALKLLSSLPTAVLRTDQCGDSAVLAEPSGARLATRCRG